MAAVLRRRFRDGLRGLLAWGVGLGALLGLYLVFWPSIQENPQINELLRSYPPELMAVFGTTDITSPAGYLESEFFSLLGPALLLIFTIRRAAATVAGLEEDGVVELWLATPLPRYRVVVEGFASLVVSATLLVLAGAAVLAVGGPAVDLQLPLENLVAGFLGLLLLGLFMGAVSLLTGAATGRSGLAGAVATLVAVAAFVVHSFAPLVDGLEAVQEASPWYWYMGSDPLTQGLDVAGLAALATGTLLMVVLSVVAYRRRDLGV